MLSWCEYKRNAEKSTSIADRVDFSRKLEIQTNRHYLRTMAEIILLCARQDLALRGHHEQQSSSNRGNFLEILQLVGSHDKVIQSRLEYGPRNASYTSPGIQNSLLHILADTVRKTVCDGVKEAGMFSILADESKDLSKQEQLAIVLRYVACKGMLHEHFLTYVTVASLTAESLTKYILETLQEFGLDPHWIVSQAYDGASVMSGQCSGVQQRVREVAPNAIYIHCYAHTLNLVLVDSVKAVPYATEFFLLLESLYVFVSTTKAHAVFMLQKQRQLHHDKQPLQLQKLSDTRWACRYGAVNAICRTYDSILATLEEIGDGSDRAKAVEAKGLYHQVATFVFIVSLVIFDRILSCTKSLSDQLQSTHVDLAQAADLVLATQSSLQEYRSDTFWGNMYEYAQSIADLYSIEVSLPTRTRRRTLPKRLEDGVVLETTGSRQHSSCSHDYKTTLYFPVLDAFLAEISRRFDKKNVNIMRAIQACNPLAKNLLCPSALQPLVEGYDLDEDAIDMEAKLAKRTLANKGGLENVGDVFVALIPLKEAFPELFKLVRISMTIAVNTALLKG